MNRLLFFSALIAGAQAFTCYTCNNRPEDDDTNDCFDKIEECDEGVKSCSSLVYTDHNDVKHYRKFCTAPGTPIYNYLMFFPGSAICQNIETTDMEMTEAPEPLVIQNPDGTVTEIEPPAHPAEHASNLLCVCTKERCNRGTYMEVLENTMLQNLKDVVKKDSNSVLDQLAKLRAVRK